ncbi:hypothetical protein [Planomonospora sp. ID82291]|uniref:hypothetical protein n=1 Tax=Planomonospora sp. ID82291 TaxID=2738136 RepID=UPI0018C40ED5|nr:hypothetical protein [Planomonospora sp. ID82291]MBG0816016.1 hypothetical protein [Planomonospora sp. ID82291]
MASSSQSSSLRTSGTAGTSRLLVAWQDPRTRAIAPIGVLEKTSDGFSFAYLRKVMDIPGFRPLLGFGDLERRYRSSALFPLFNQRLMDSRRPDYRRYLTVLGLSGGASPMTVLGRSGGRRAGDSIFLVPEPCVEEDGRTSAAFFVHGSRHRPGAESCISVLHEGELLDLRDDPSNPVNQRALLVTREGTELGWVPDLLLDYVHHVRDAGAMTIRVAQVNGSDVPPNLRLRVRLHGSVPCGYLPFRGEDWATTA